MTEVVVQSAFEKSAMTVVRNTYKGLLLTCTLLSHSTAKINNSHHLELKFLWVILLDAKNSFREVIPYKTSIKDYF